MFFTRRVGQDYGAGSLPFQSHAQSLTKPLESLVNFCGIGYFNLIHGTLFHWLGRFIVPSTHPRFHRHPSPRLVLPLLHISARLASVARYDTPLTARTSTLREMAFLLQVGRQNGT